MALRRRRNSLFEHGSMSLARKVRTGCSPHVAASRIGVLPDSRELDMHTVIFSGIIGEAGKAGQYMNLTRF
ncbi:hypothetical protein [Rhodanobacter koreensis]